MQGHKKSLSSFSENLSFDHSSSSSDSGKEPQISWNGMQNHVPDCIISSSGETSVRFMHQARHRALNLYQSTGEASSSAGQSQGDHLDRKREHSWSIHPQAHRYESSNNLPFDNAYLSSNGNQIGTSSLLPLHSASEAFPQDLNMRSNLESQEDNDDCQVTEHPENCLSSISLHGRTTPEGTSSRSFGAPSYLDDGEDRPSCSIDGRRLSCKRKTLEAGSSSEPGSSGFYHHTERIQCDSPQYPQINITNISTSSLANDLGDTNGPGQANPRLMLGVDGSHSVNPVSLVSRGTVENSRRSFRLRVNGSNQQNITPENPLVLDDDGHNAHAPSLSSRNAARLYLHQRLFGSNPAHGQSGLSHVPYARRNSQSRWTEASSSRASTSSSASDIFYETEATTVYEDPVTSEIPSSTVNHPMLIPCIEMGSSSSQQSVDGNLGSGSNGGNSNARNVRSTSRSGSNRASPLYHRRLSELVRRSLLSSASTESGDQNSNSALRPGSAAPLQETPLSSASGSRHHHVPSSRSAILERNLDSVFGLPHSLRSLAASGEGRSSMMSEELRHVLDLVRRGEGLRFEDVMLLDHSIFFNMADINDRHRDMRMDVDNMSYEELLALEERIGNVCTGLKEGTILKHLKQRKFKVTRPKDVETEPEPCSICREEYTKGDMLGTLDCGHDFHRDCIKQWLALKNLCPICKTTGLNK